MATKNVTRVCPFCGKTIRLGECAIVATAVEIHQTAGGSDWDADESAQTESTRTLVEQKSESPRGGYFSRLKSPNELADPSALPRRACTECSAALPLELDNVEARTLAVVGLNRSGKSYFIGSTLTAATRSDALDSYGVRRFTAIEETPSRLHNDYFQQLFRNDYELAFTDTYAHLEKPPLLFDVEMDDGSRFILVVHDVSGEALIDRSARARTAGFVARAHGIVFTVDPLDVNALTPSLPLEDIEAVGQRNLDQVSLLESVMRDLRDLGNSGVPIALVLTKLDLLRQTAPGLLAVDNRDAWKDRVRSRAAATRALLMDLHETKMVRLMESHRGPTSFHAVSVLGTVEDRRRRGGKPSPIGVMDPLGTVLEQMRLTATHAH